MQNVFQRQTRMSAFFIHSYGALCDQSTFSFSNYTSKKLTLNLPHFVSFFSLFKYCSTGKMVGESGILRFKKLSDKAFVPARGSVKAAGFDLKSAYNVKVPARGKALCMTDIQIALPSGCYGRIAPRSGLALKHGLDVGAGVIDEDYRGNVGVILFNHSDSDFEVKEGDRIAQLICERILYPDLVEVHDLDKTERDVNGFGSTGTN